MKVKFSWIFGGIEFDVSFADHDRINWVKFLNRARDFRMLYESMACEYAGEVFDAAKRLRQDVLPEALSDTSPDSGLQKSYHTLQRALRDFLTKIRSVGIEQLSNRDLRLDQVTPIGTQWVFVSALTELRTTFKREIEFNCIIFGINQPEQFTGQYELPDAVAEEYAQELAPLPVTGQPTQLPRLAS